MVGTRVLMHTCTRTHPDDDVTILEDGDDAHPPVAEVHSGGTASTGATTTTGTIDTTDTSSCCGHTSTTTSASSNGSTGSRTCRYTCSTCTCGGAACDDAVNAVHCARRVHRQSVEARQQLLGDWRPVVSNRLDGLPG
jgi:hypothetical protein